MVFFALGNVLAFLLAVCIVGRSDRLVAWALAVFGEGMLMGVSARVLVLHTDDINSHAGHRLLLMLGAGLLAGALVVSVKRCVTDHFPRPHVFGRQVKLWRRLPLHFSAWPSS